ncbi:hypothetical protein CCHL11_00249 [Colletotrichum chlorophyti]|uniref:Secreted protein n=1 Tax=Colletotrichum chlorophyti TaxID=708187 RepID=A0A1Q8RV47_9PEZI|nr:hypothetical protein CCHL11_00249 [Colletotrichum chlorophyti]
MKTPTASLLQGATFLAAVVTASGAASISRRADSSACKLRADQNAHYSVGFGYDFDCAPSVGAVKALMIFIDFPDQTASEATPQEVYDIFFPQAATWLETSSYGRMSLNLTADTTRFYRMPRSAASYQFERPLSQQTHQEYIKDAIESWLHVTNTPVPEVNSTDGPLTDVLYIIPTANATSIALSAAMSQSAYSYNVNYIARKAVTMGFDTFDYWGYKALNHETGHTFCLPDLYPIPDGWPGQYTGNWDMMAKVDASSPDFFAWNKWRLGWLADDQIECIVPSASVGNGSTSTTHKLSPLETVGGVKAVVLKQSETSALVAEVRSKNGNNAYTCGTGVLLYTVATDIETGGGPIRIVDVNPGWGSAPCANDELDDAPLSLSGEGVRSYTLAEWGVTVSIVEQDGEHYTIRVEVN